MSTSSLNTSFVPRANLRRTLTFRPIVNTCYYWYSIYLAFHGIYLIWDVVSRMNKNTPSVMVYQWIAWGFLFVGFLFSHFILRRLAQSKIHVHSEGIGIEAGDKTTEIRFEDMAELRLPPRKFSFQGFFSVKMKSGKRFFFSVALERSEYILEAIASNRPDIVDMNRLADFRIEAIATDHLLARLKTHLTNSGRKSVIRYFISPFIQTLLVGSFFENSLPPEKSLASLWMYFAIINAGIGIFSDLSVNYFMGGKTKESLKNNPRALIRDMKSERKMFQVSDYLHWGLSLGFLAYFIFRGWFVSHGG